MTLIFPFGSRHHIDGGFVDPYITKVLGIQSGNLIGYWPMDEKGGSVANDQSPENNDGAYTGVDLANAAGPTGIGLCPWWDGTNDVNDIYSAGFASDWSGNQHTISCWIKVNAAAVWEDSTEPVLNKLRKKSEFADKRCLSCKWFNLCKGNFRFLGTEADDEYWLNEPSCYLTDQEIT